MTSRGSASDMQLKLVSAGLPSLSLGHQCIRA